MYDHPFGWNDANSDMLKYVSKTFQGICKEKLGMKLSLGGGGHRKYSLGKKLKDSDKIWKLHKKYTQRAQDCSKNCVWLSAVLVIATNDESLADKMITMLNENNERHEWMFLISTVNCARIGTVFH